MVTLATDLFDRGNGALGANWTTITGGNPFTIISQQVSAANVSLDADMRYSAIAWPNDQWAQIRIVSLTGAPSESGLGLALRASSSARTFYRCVVNNLGTNNWFIVSFKATAYSGILAQGTHSIATGDIVYAEIQGNTIVMKWAAAATPTVFTNVVSYTDSSSPITTGSPGIAYSSQPTTHILDDWIGGDFTSAITWDQLHYRWRDDAASPAFLAAENTAITRQTLQNTRLRTLLNTAGGDPPSVQILREWNRALADAIWRPLQVLGGAAVAFGAAGATSSSTGSATAPIATYPTGITKGQLLVLFVTNRPNTATVATPAGWTVLPNSTATGGVGSQAADAGLMRGTIFTREADGTETGTITLAITGGTSAGAKILRYTKTTGKVWSLAVEAGADNVAGVWSATAAANPGIQAGDILLICSAPSSDCALASQAVTQPGVTFGTLVNRASDPITTGFDTKVEIDEFPVNSITTVTGPPVFVMTPSGTGSASEAGVSLFLRIRQVDAPLVLALSPNITAGGVDNTTALLTSPGGTFGGGKLSDDTNPFPAVDLAPNTYGEWEMCIQATATAQVGEVYRLRETIDGVVLTTYTNTPEMTIASPAAVPLMVLESPLFRRLHGRIFGRVN